MSPPGEGLVEEDAGDLAGLEDLVGIAERAGKAAGRTRELVAVEKDGWPIRAFRYGGTGRYELGAQQAWES